MANIKVTLPRGHWIELRDPWDVTEPDRRPLKKALMAMGRAQQQRLRSVPRSNLTPIAPQLGGEPDELPDAEVLEAGMADLEAFEREVVMFFLIAWDLDLEPSADVLKEIPYPLFSAINSAIAPLYEELFPNAARKATEEDPTTP